MSMLDAITVRCGLCGTETEFDEILSTSSAGSSDLDTRSPAMRWAIIQTLVQRCPGCGYCASDVSVINPDAPAVISGREYQDQLNDPTYPELANSFLCQSILLDRELRNNHAESAWAVIKAAWVCDDCNYTDQAIACRRMAEINLAVAEARNLNPAVQDETNVAIRVDLLRRSHQVYAARKLISERRGKITDDFIKRILDYQNDLIDKNDFSRHTISEARSHIKQGAPEVVAKGELKAIESVQNDPNYDVGSDEGVFNANEHQVEIGKRSEQFSSDLNEDTDAENLWSESDIRDFTWEDHQREMENEKFLAHVQKFRDVLREDGIEAAGAYLEKKIKAEEEAKKNKERWDEIIKITGVVLVTAFFISQCGDSNNQRDCYYEYGKYGAERICE